MNLQIIRILAWLLLITILVATLGPMDVRPTSTLPVQLERLLAFGVLGVIFALVYPRHLVLVALLIFGAAVGFEVLQNVVPGRHGRLPDFVAKMVGGGFGVAIGWVLINFARVRGGP